MSEYQYYEFRAIDQRLDPEAMLTLRSITSRATISPTKMVNVYHYGDFRGDPARLMEQYFDAHLYQANWGSRRLMLRLPANSFSLATVQPYEVVHGIEAWSTQEHIILDFSLNYEDWDIALEAEDGLLDALLPLRSELVAGDFRCLYLGWLIGVQSDQVDETTLEPPVPPRLQQLSAPQRAFVEFFGLEPELLQVAVAVSEQPSMSSERAELAVWVAKLSREELDQVVVGLLQGEGATLAGELQRRFRDHQAEQRNREDRGRKARPRRTVEELLEQWDRLREEKEGQAAAAEAQRVRAQVAARALELDQLAGREEELWQQVELAIESRKPKGYEDATRRLKELDELARHRGRQDEFSQRIRALRQRHRSKRSLQGELDRAGLPR